LRPDGGTAKVGVDEQHARAGSARQRGGQVDRRQRLAVARPWAGDGHDPDAARLLKPLDLEAQVLVLLGGKRAGTASVAPACEEEGCMRM
jgi:hypothetical protein